MDVICRNISGLKDKTLIERVTDRSNIDLPQSVTAFFEKNNGGIPLKKEFSVGDDEYEVRCFLSFNEGDHNAIKAPLGSFQKETNGKIFPLAKDSGDNYFCLNLENKKIYYWDKDENLYYNIAEDFAAFIGYLT